MRDKQTASKPLKALHNASKPCKISYSKAQMSQTLGQAPTSPSKILGASRLSWRFWSACIFRTSGALGDLLLGASGIFFRTLFN